MKKKGTVLCKDKRVLNEQMKKEDCVKKPLVVKPGILPSKMTRFVRLRCPGK